MSARDHLVPAPAARPGYTPITRIGEPGLDTGMDFGLLRLRAGEALDLGAPLETACLLLDGEVDFAWDGGERAASRRSLLDEPPTAVHAAAGARLAVTARAACELVVVRADNPARFATRVFDGESLAGVEHRDRGVLEDTAYRIVRTVFDLRNRPDARLVLGEVVAPPGHWSSYPPHHHPQPELYHYRFVPAQGYGHGELGDDVVKVRSGDTLKITAGLDHSQVAAPGYAMYYVWAIRHLPGAPYTVPEFTAGHEWMRAPGARPWSPGGAK